MRATCSRPAHPALAITAKPYPGRGATLVTVYAADHPGLFYRIAGAIHLAGGNIIDARIHTLRDGTALDNFLVQDPLGRPFDEPGQIQRIETFIRNALDNRQQLMKRPRQEAAIAHARRSLRRGVSSPHRQQGPRTASP